MTRMSRIRPLEVIYFPIALLSFPKNDVFLLKSGR